MNQGKVWFISNMGDNLLTLRHVCLTPRYIHTFPKPIPKPYSSASKLFMVDNNKQTNNHIDGPFDKAMEH
jgi:hypothetical protein